MRSRSQRNATKLSRCVTTAAQELLADFERSAVGWLLRESGRSHNHFRARELRQQNACECREAGPIHRPEGRRDRLIHR